MTEGERRLCDFLYGKSGGFYTHLFEAIFRADRKNMAKLESAFTEEVTAYHCYAGIEDYWDKLEKEYLNPTPVKLFIEMPEEG